MATPTVLPRDALVCSAAYRIRALLGRGSFGAVYDAVDTRSGCHVALKTEEMHADAPQLATEWLALHVHLNCKEGIPRAIWFGTCDAAHVKVLVMQRLGASVEALRAAVADAGSDAATDTVAPLPLYVVQYIALQALDRLHACHEEWLAHRDIKPENLLFEVGGVATAAEVLLGASAPHDAAAAFAAGAMPRSWPRVFLIDFGLCKMMRDGVAHIPLRGGKTLAGTPRYASLAAHRGLEQSRRDDLESLLYVLLFLARGKLPWQGLGDDRGDRDDAAYDAADDAGNFPAIAAAKARLAPRDLCAGLPAAFALTLEHARSLAFDAMPDYALLTRAWRHLRN